MLYLIVIINIYNIMQLAANKKSNMAHVKPEARLHRLNKFIHIYKINKLVNHHKNKAL